MNSPSRPTLHYAPPASRSRRIHWFALGTLAGLAGASVFVIFYETLNEPFLGPADWRDVLVLRVLPMPLVVCWCLWALAVARKTRPRLVAVLVLLIGVPIGAWCGHFTLAAHRNFESDQAQVAEWDRMAVEEAASRPHD